MVKALHQSRTERLRRKGPLSSRNSTKLETVPQTGARGRRGWSLPITAACLGAALLAISIVCLLRHRGSHPQTPRSYTLLDLGLAGSDDDSFGGAWAVINQNGDVAGEFQDAHGHTLPCLFRVGMKEPLLAPGFDNGEVNAINSWGAAVGAATLNGGETEYPVLWQHGRITLLAPPGVEGEAHGINDHGSVVWTLHDRKGDRGYALIRGVRISLGDLLPVAINNHDQIACDGQDGRVYLWDRGHAKPLTPAGRYHPIALSDRGTVVGVLDADSGFWPFECNRNDTALRLPMGAATRGSDPAIAAFAAGVNDKGDVVGGLFFERAERYSGFIYSGHVMRDINRMIAPAHGWHVELACSINNAGQIAALATYRGQRHIVRLTPRQNAPWWSLQSLWPHHPRAAG